MRVRYRRRGPAARLRPRPPRSVDDVAAELSDLAAGTLDAGLAVARAKVGEDAASVRLAVIAMGKCGGHELNRTDREDVCSIRPDGSHRRLLTGKLKQGAEPFDPDFSPSGRQIAFTLGPGTAADVFTLRADGSRLGALTNRSPNGRHTSPASSASPPRPTHPGAAPDRPRPRRQRPASGADSGSATRAIPQPLLSGALASAPVWAPG